MGLTIHFLVLARQEVTIVGKLFSSPTSPARATQGNLFLSAIRSFGRIVTEGRLV
jgi:hypothetical protein